MNAIDQAILIRVVTILKRRFPNLTSEETVRLAAEIVMATAEEKT